MTPKRRAIILLIIIIINIIEYSYSYYILKIYFLKFRLIDHFTVVADTNTFTLPV